MIVAAIVVNDALFLRELDACVSMHRQMTSGRVQIDVASTASGKQTSHSEVSYIRPDRARVRISTIAMGGTAPALREFTLIKDKVYGLDIKANEWLERPAGTKGTLGERLTNVIGRLDEPAYCVLDADALKRYLEPFRKMKGWSIKKDSVGSIFSWRVASVGSYTLRFTENHRLIELKSEAKVSKVTWRLRYERPPSSITWKPSFGSKKVTSFRERPKPPTFANSQASALYQQSYRAYRGLTKLAYSVSDDEGLWRITFGKSSASQKGPGGIFAYSGGVLTFGRQRLKCVPKELSTRLESNRITMEPTLRILVAGGNPLERLISSTMKVSYRGSFKVGNETRELLEGAEPGYKIMLEISKKTSLLLSAESTVLDERGRRIGGSKRTYSY